MSTKSTSPDPTTQSGLDVVDERGPPATGGAWYRGENCNFNPLHEDLATAAMVADRVLRGWLPPEPLINPKTRVTAFGSCFARHICEWLNARDFNVLNRDAESSAHIVNMGDGLVNTFSILEQLRWAFDGEHYEGEYWHGPKAAILHDSEGARRDTRRILLDTDVFIITLGLSEIWCDKTTGGVFWRGVPSRLFDPERHAFRVVSFEENKRNIRSIHDLIRKHRPDAKVIFSVSPIPLAATFRPVSCITANSVSKALLRGAVDEVHREVSGEGAMFYWPSYEIVLDVFDRPWMSDRRHVRKPVLNFVMTLFERSWCSGSKPSGPGVAEAYAMALLATGTVAGRIGKGLSAAIPHRDAAGLQPLLASAEADPEKAFAAAAIRDVLDEWEAR